MNATDSGKALYYAFVSHKSTDAKFALKLQKFIETYNLPTNIRQIAGLQKRRLSPVCSYEVDFSSSPLLDEMHGKLKRSRYLILICSEELLKSGTKYVNYEIRTFIQCKKEEGVDPLTRIIPVIVSGEFGSAEHECCPEALRELGDNCPIALDRKKYKNDRELFLHIIAALLDIDYTVMEDRDKKRQRIRKTVAGIAAAVLLATGIGLGEYFIPRQSHYVDFVMKEGIPEGIGPVRAEDYRKMQGHYVITRSKHKVQSLEYVNAYGKRIDHPGNIFDGDRPSAYIFAYTGSTISSVTYEDKAGEPYFLMQYSGNSISSVDLKDPWDAGEAFYIGSGYESDPSMLLADVNQSARSDISRFRYEYAPEGYVTKVIFCSDSTGRLGQDNAVYGFAYTLDEKGRITETYFLDALGEPRLNSEGVYCRKIVYDDRNDPVEWINLGSNGQPVADTEGIVRCVFSYDDHHNRTGLSFFDQNGDPLFVGSYGGAGQRQYVDDRGNLILVELLDTDGSICRKFDYSVMAYTYDENGFMASRTYRNPEGQPVMDTATNYAEVRYVNDEEGNPVEIAFYDAEGNLVNNAHGYAKELVEYDAMGRELKNTYLTADGTPADYREYGYSIQETAYDERGREISLSYYGPDGEPVNTKGPIFGFGYHKLEAVYEYGAHTKQTLTYYDADGNPVNMHSSLGEEYSRTEIVMQNGEITYMANFCVDGSVFGYVLEVKTDRSAQAEPITTYRYTDGDGKVLQENVTYYRLNGVEKKKIHTVYDENGNAVTVQEALYHDNGQQKTDRVVEYTAAGEVKSDYLREYDGQGKLLKETLIEPASAEFHTYIVYTIYDAQGNPTGEERITLRSDGTTASTVNCVFAPDGSNETVETTFYDPAGARQGTIVETYEGKRKISNVEHTYNADGAVTETVEFRFNSDGGIDTVKFFYYDSNGLLWTTSEYIYHTSGNKTQITTYYDENGNVLDTFQRLLDKDNQQIG